MLMEQEPEIGDDDYWWRRIDAAEERGHFTATDYSRAGGWQTCACGHQSQAIPRKDRGSGSEPIDGLLNNLGMHFYYIIGHGTKRDGKDPSLVKRYGDNVFDAARECMRRIEERANEIIIEEMLEDAEHEPLALVKKEG